MLSRLHGLCSWGRGKLWPEPSLTSLQKRRQRDRNKILLESDVARKTAGRNEIEIAGEGDRARVLGSPNLESWGRAAKDILAAIRSIPAVTRRCVDDVRSFCIF